MGFSITRFLTGLAGSAVSAIPIVGPLLSAAASGFASAPRPITFLPTGPQPIALRGPPRAQPVILRSPSTSTGPQVITGGGGATTLAGGAPLFMAAGALIRELLRRASAAIGKRITRAGVLSLTREVGIVSAAAALALTAVEVAQIIAAKPTRRRRGITASQIATTKATMRRLDSLNRAIASACPPARRRRAPSRAAIHHAK